MFADDIVFSRTPLGHQEIANPEGKLPPRLRRCLALVDGERDCGSLAPLFRVGELDEALEELRQGRYIAAAVPPA